ncbi:MAG: HAD-IA family hydrolase, partial [Acidobacteria bacterium]|nr:HAD-IA family hydrolase [Acidobacteriota bacterium]
HQSAVRDFERGRIGLDEYVCQAVFYRERTFGSEDFKDFMFAQSELKPETLDIIARLARNGKYLLCTLNNESLELNLHRIERFGLREYFSLFFTSSFLGVLKPDEAIYRIALSVTQRRPEESVFIDDRAKNAEVARQCGMRAIHFQSPSQLRSELEALGVES